MILAFISGTAALWILGPIVANLGMNWAMGAGGLEAEAQREVDMKAQRNRRDFIQSQLAEHKGKARIDENFGGLQQSLRRRMAYSSEVGSQVPVPGHEPDAMLDGLLGKLGMSQQELRRRTDPTRVGNFNEMGTAVRGAANNG